MDVLSSSGSPSLIELGDLLPAVAAVALANRSARHAEWPTLACCGKTWSACGAVLGAIALIRRWEELTLASPAVLLTAIVLLDRLPAWATPFALAVDDYEYLFGMAYSLAFKFHEDGAAVPSRELAAAARMDDVGMWNGFERAFLGAIGFGCFVTAGDLRVCEAGLVAEAAASCLAADLYPELERAGLVPPSGLLRGRVCRGGAAAYGVIGAGVPARCSAAGVASDDGMCASEVTDAEAAALGADFVEERSLRSFSDDCCGVVESRGAWVDKEMERRFGSDLSDVECAEEELDVEDVVEWL
jgi:hypothetical protein